MTDTKALLWQGFFCIAMFVSTFICYLAPIFIFSRRNRRLQGNDFATEEDLQLPHHWSNVNLTNQLKKYRLKRLLSNCNCVSAGVFLGVCFLNLIPCVEDEFSKLIQDFSIIKQIFGSFPLGQFTVICGLFLVLILESALSRCFSKREEGHTHGTSTIPILYLDEESNEARIDEQNYDQEVLLLSDESQSERNSGRDSKKTQNGHRNNGNVTENASNDEHDFGHGHSHFNVDFFQERSDSMLSFFILMFATSIHSLFEGLALGLQTDISNAIHLFIGIILHEALVALALGLNAVRLQQENIKLFMHLKFAFLFSLTIPVGNLLGILLGYTPGHFGRFISAIFQGFAAGTFIHVTFLELIPEELLSSDCDTREDELQKLLNENQTDDPNAPIAANTADQTNSNESAHLEPSVPNNSQTNGRNKRSSHSHNHGNIKLRKILLLLLGFFIMTLIPFIFKE